MSQIVNFTATEAFGKLLLRLGRYGKKITRNGLETIELTSDVCKINMKYPLVQVPTDVRNISPQYAMAEAYWILSGINSAEFITKHAPRMARFLNDETQQYDGFYGTPFNEQFQTIIDEFHLDKFTRKARVVIAQGADKYFKSKDNPCTTEVIWLIDTMDRLNCYVTMRSSDVWQGLPYDLFVYTCMTLMVLQTLRKSKRQDLVKLKLGSLYNYAASRHVYIDNNGLANCKDKDLSLIGENIINHTTQILTLTNDATYKWPILDTLEVYFDELDKGSKVNQLCLFDQIDIIDGGLNEQRN